MDRILAGRGRTNGGGRGGREDMVEESERAGAGRWLYSRASGRMRPGRRLAAESARRGLFSRGLLVGWCGGFGRWCPGEERCVHLPCPATPTRGGVAGWNGDSTGARGSARVARRDDLAR
jgi:hypothetical protein